MFVYWVTSVAFPQDGRRNCSNWLNVQKWGACTHYSLYAVSCMPHYTLIFLKCLVFCAYAWYGKRTSLCTTCIITKMWRFLTELSFLLAFEDSHRMSTAVRRIWNRRHRGLFLSFITPVQPAFLIFWQILCTCCLYTYSMWCARQSEYTHARLRASSS